MMNHNQMVENMLYELDPNYDNLSDERKQKLKNLVESYLDPNTSDSKKEVIMNQLQTTKVLTGSLHPIHNDNNQEDSDEGVSQKMMNKAWKDFKKESKQAFVTTDPISSLIILCYMNNESILETQKEQQRILDSLINIQQKTVDREREMLAMINEQQKIIKEQQETIQELRNGDCNGE